MKRLFNFTHQEKKIEKGYIFPKYGRWVSPLYSPKFRSKKYLANPKHTKSKELVVPFISFSQQFLPFNVGQNGNYVGRHIECSAKTANEKKTGK
jgi:hypothetical protein